MQLFKKRKFSLALQTLKWKKLMNLLHHSLELSNIPLINKVNHILILFKHFGLTATKYTFTRCTITQITLKLDFFPESE